MDRREVLIGGARVALALAGPLAWPRAARAGHGHGPAGIQAGLVKAEKGYKEFNVILQLHHYTPQVIDVDLGDRVKLNLQSTDVDHGFHLDGYGVDVKVPGLLAIKTVEFVADKAGAFRFRCSSTCGPFHPFMIGKFVVHPNYRFWAALGAVVLAPVATLAYVGARREGNGAAPGGNHGDRS